ncbi:Gfo/Idh/MocA family oxidoreductase [soil metagenome]
MAALRGAVIGCGFFAMNHLQAWHDIADVDLVAICDTRPERLKIVGDQFGVARRYTDAPALFADGGFDFVDVATTLPSHKSLVEMAARAGIPVICQKPFAATLADGKAMVATCAAAGVPLMVHENFRWQSPIRAAQQVLANGDIGDPVWGRVSFRSGYDVISGQPYLAEGERFIVEDLGVHCLDVARFLFGDATSVAATTQRVNPKVRGEDVATVLLRHGDSVSSIVDCSYVSIQEKEAFPETILEIDGTQGSIRLSLGYRLAVTTKRGAEVRDVSPPLLHWATKPWHNVQESVFAIQQHWVNCLRAGTEPATSGRDNLKTLALVESVYQSAATKQVVDPDALLR